MPTADHNGQWILNTRPAHQAGPLSQRIRELGGQVMEFPLLEISPLPVTAAKQQIIDQLPDYDMTIFISANAVNYGLQALTNLEQLQQMPLASVGQSTAAALQTALGSTHIITPSQQFNSEGLLALPELQQVNGKRILIVRGRGGRELLAEQLTARGASVDYLEVYERCLPNPDKLAKLLPELEQHLQNNALAAIVITSGENLRNLLQLTDSHLHHYLHAVQLVVINERLATLARELGFTKPAWVACQAEDAAIIQVLQAHHLLAE